MIFASIYAWLLAAAVAVPPATPVSATGPTFSGTVHLQGRPVAGATVWLMGVPERPPGAVANGRSAELAHTRTDQQGRFTLPVKPSLRWVVARDGAGRVGWFNPPLWRDVSLEPALVLDLFETGEVRGQLLDADGKALHGRVRVNTVSQPGGAPPRTFADWLDLPGPLASQWEATLNADGRFRLRDIPLRSTITVALDAAGYKDLRLEGDQGDWPTRRVARPGSAHLRFTGAEEKQLVGLNFFLRRTNLSNGQPGDHVFYWLSAQAGPHNPLRLTGLYPGHYALTPDRASNAPVGFIKSIRFVVKEGEEVDVPVAVHPRACVQGRVLDRTTGLGIPGVAINVLANVRNTLQYRASVRTDTHGRYRAFVEPGRLSVAVTSVPAGYVRNSIPSSQPRAVGSTERIEFVPLKIERAVKVEGIVQDAAGRPVPWVRVVRARDALNLHPPYSDAAGRFTLTDLGPNDVAVLRARTAAAVTEGGITVDMANQKGPIKLVLSEAAAFHLRGRVCDDRERPVPDAAVLVGWRDRDGYGMWLETYRTDADGRFETQALWPGDQYYVMISAAKHGRLESAAVTGKAGKRLDLGTLVLPRTAGHVAGGVVDRQGRPVPAAHVFNEGDGLTRLEAATDAAGRFELRGLYDGPVYVFVRQPGYRFTMVQARAGDTAVRVRLLKTNEKTPAAEQPLARPPTYVAAEKRLTQHLLDRLWALPRSVTNGSEAHVLKAMAQVDLDRARQWLADEGRRKPAAAGPGSRLWRTIREAEVVEAARDDPEEALTLLTPLPTADAFSLLLHWAEGAAKSDQTKALLFVEEAIVKARGLPLPDRAWSLAQTGELAARLGQRVSGLKLLHEAADLAGRMGNTGRQGYARRQVAAMLALHDLKNARELVKGLTDHYAWNSAHAELAVRCALTDLPAALALLKEMRPDHSFIRDETRLRIAYRLAATKPTEAIKQAEAIADMGYRASALSGVAALIAKREPARAHALIDRVLDQYLDKPEQFLSWMNFGGRTTFAAWTAYDARLAKYPDMASVVARVLAARPTGKDLYSSREVNNTLLHTALALALTDPFTARELVEQALPPGQPIPSDRVTLFAVALADPERAVGLIDERLAHVGKSPIAFHRSGLIELLLTLTAPTEQERIRQLGIWVNASSTPGSEDR